MHSATHTLPSPPTPTRLRAPSAAVRKASAWKSQPPASPALLSQLKTVPRKPTHKQHLAHKSNPTLNSSTTIRTPSFKKHSSSSSSLPSSTINNNKSNLVKKPSTLPQTQKTLKHARPSARRAHPKKTTPPSRPPALPSKRAPPAPKPCAPRPTTSPSSVTTPISISAPCASASLPPCSATPTAPVLLKPPTPTTSVTSTVPTSTPVSNPPPMFYPGCEDDFDVVWGYTVPPSTGDLFLDLLGGDPASLDYAFDSPVWKGWISDL